MSEGVGEITVNLDEAGMIRVKNSLTGRILTLEIEEALELQDLLNKLLKNLK